MSVCTDTCVYTDKYFSLHTSGASFSTYFSHILLLSTCSDILHIITNSPLNNVKVEMLRLFSITHESKYTKYTTECFCEYTPEMKPCKHLNRL